MNCLTYDNVATIIDPAGNVTTRQYDTMNRLLSETRPESGTAN